MGVFEVAIAVGHPDGGDMAPVTAIVDTGADHTMLPVSLFAGLSIPETERTYWSLADGSEIELSYGIARIAIDEREYPCPVIFGPEEQYLLGRHYLGDFQSVRRATSAPAYAAPFPRPPDIRVNHPPTKRRGPDAMAQASSVLLYRRL